MVIYSMTAFSCNDTVLPFASLHWEIRSVNHRYIELNFKLPEVVKHLEGTLRNTVRNQLQRGKIDCFLKIDFVNDINQTFVVDFQRVEKIIGVSYDINEQLKKYQLNAPISPLDILNWPNVLQNQSIDVSSLQTAVEKTLYQAITELKDARAREGNTLKLFMLERVHKINEAILYIKQNWHNAISDHRHKLKEKLEGLNLIIDQNRLEQEILYLIQKSDITEELDRLETHNKEVARILKQGGVIGKRLDFFMQELNRETNTIASKTLDSQCIQTTINLKVWIEEMREQIQNVE